MTKLERALEAAQELPEELREEIGENLLHFIDKYLALREDIAIGVAQLDRGETLDGEVVFAKLKARFVS